MSGTEIRRVVLSEMEDEYHHPACLARGHLERVEPGRLSKSNKRRFVVLTRRYLAIFSCEEDAAVDEKGYLHGFCDGHSLKHAKPGQGVYIPLENVDTVLHAAGSNKFTLSASGNFPDGTPVAKSIGPGDGCEYFTAPSDRIALEWTALIRDWSKVRKQELKDGGPSIIKAGPNRYSTEQWKERRASTSAVPDSVKKSRRRSSLIQRIFSRMSHAELEADSMRKRREKTAEFVEEQIRKDFTYLHFVGEDPSVLKPSSSTPVYRRRGDGTYGEPVLMCGWITARKESSSTAINRYLILTPTRLCLFNEEESAEIADGGFTFGDTNLSHPVEEDARRRYTAGGGSVDPSLINLGLGLSSSLKKGIQAGYEIPLANIVELEVVRETGKAAAVSSGDGGWGGNFKNITPDLYGKFDCPLDAAWPPHVHLRLEGLLPKGCGAGDDGLVTVPEPKLNAVVLKSRVLKDKKKPSKGNGSPSKQPKPAATEGTSVDDALYSVPAASSADKERRKSKLSTPDFYFSIPGGSSDSANDASGGGGGGGGGSSPSTAMDASSSQRLRSISEGVVSEASAPTLKIVVENDKFFFMNRQLWMDPAPKAAPLPNYFLRSLPDSDECKTSERYRELKMTGMEAELTMRSAKVLEDLPVEWQDDNNYSAMYANCFGATAIKIDLVNQTFVFDARHPRNRDAWYLALLAAMSHRKKQVSDMAFAGSFDLVGSVDIRLKSAGGASGGHNPLHSTVKKRRSVAGAPTSPLK